MNNKPSLSNVLHFLVELTLIVTAAAAFGLLIFLANISRIGGIP